MRKRRTSITAIFIFTVLICFILAGCDPVADTKRGRQPVSADLNIPLSFSRHTNSVTVMFPSVKYADEYGYTINIKGEEGVAKPSLFSSSLSYQNGLWSDEIPAERNLLPSTDYTVTLYARNSLSDWTVVGVDNVTTKSGDVNDEIRAFVWKRSSDSAVIEIADELNPGNMIYKVVGLDSGEKIYEQDDVENGKIIIDGLDSGKEYSIKIYQALSSAPDKFGTNPAELTIEKYDASLDSKIELSFTDGIFFVDFSKETGLIANIDKVSIIRLEEEASGKYSVEFTKDASEIDSSYKLSFDSEDFMKSLDFGIFAVVAYDKDSQSETKEAKMSNSVDASTGIIIKGIKEERPQSVWFNIKEFAEGVEITSDALSMDGSYSAEFGDDNASILLKGFTSKTKYEAGSIRLSVSYDGKSFITDVPEFTTGSFTGYYLWRPESNPPSKGNWATEFAINVVNADDVSSIYSYYIYPASSDEYWRRSGSVTYTIQDLKNDQTAFRIMPLVDTSKGESEINDIPYSNAPFGYIWNNEKWNSSGYPGSSLNPTTLNYVHDINESTSVNPSKDSYRFYSESTANLLGEQKAVTSTSFVFTDDGTKLSVEFFNMIVPDGTSSLALNSGNYYLRKNPDGEGKIAGNLFEASDESYYYYVLEYVSEVTE